MSESKQEASREEKCPTCGSVRVSDFFCTAEHVQELGPHFPLTSIYCLNCTDPWHKEITTAWPNCTVVDCCWKVCLGLNDTLCFPHYFNLPMKIENGEVVPVFPDEATKEECYGWWKSPWPARSKPC
jgi:hypothetical protein